VEEGYQQNYLKGRTYKIGIQRRRQYTMKANRFVTSGYLPEQNKTFYDMPELGFVTRDGFSHSGNLNNEKYKENKIKQLGKRIERLKTSA
jgi:hypothetical protein